MIFEFRSFEGIQLCISVVFVATSSIEYIDLVALHNADARFADSTSLGVGGMRSLVVSSSHGQKVFKRRLCPLCFD